MASTLSGFPLLISAGVTLFAGIFKGARVKNYFLFSVLAVVEALASAVPLYVLADSVRDLKKVLSTAVYATAALAAIILLLVDLATTFNYVRNSVENEGSLSARSVILFGILPGALTVAVLFKGKFNLSKIQVVELDVNGSEIALYIGLGGVITAVICGFLGAFLTTASALRDDGSNASKGDNFSRLWFSLFFLVVPLAGVSVGVAGLLTSKESAGGYLFVQALLLPLLLSNALALMRDMLKSTVDLDRVDDNFF